MRIRLLWFTKKTFLNNTNDVIVVCSNNSEMGCQTKKSIKANKSCVQNKR